MHRHRALFDHLPGELLPACRVQNGPVEEKRELRLSIPRPPNRASSKLERDELNRPLAFRGLPFLFRHQGQFDLPPGDVPPAYRVQNGPTEGISGASTVAGCPLSAPAVVSSEHVTLV